MKRRSPWLAFAACALLNGTIAAEPAPSPAERPQAATVTVSRPSLALSKAVGTVEAELEKRGLAKEHFISSVALVSTKAGNPYYAVQIEPPILTPIEKAAANSTAPVPTRLTFQVWMDGDVTTKLPDSARQRVRVIKSN